MSHADNQVKTFDNLQNDFSILFLEDYKLFQNQLLSHNRGKSIFAISFKIYYPLIFYPILKDIISEIKNAFEELRTSPFTIYNKKYEHIILGFAIDKTENFIPIMEAYLGKLYYRIHTGIKFCYFDFGIGRAYCDYITNLNDIFHEIEVTMEINFNSNIQRKNGTKANQLYNFFGDNRPYAQIQPVCRFDKKTNSFFIDSGEVFVGGHSTYKNYDQLLHLIPNYDSFEHFDLLLLEKLIISCKNIPGLLKFNISPQTLLKYFNNQENIKLFTQLVQDNNIQPKNFRFELIEHSYEETDIKLHDVCSNLNKFGFTFAIDDFGIKSSSHQVILDLGELVQELKLDPLMFTFDHDRDIRNIDNLAFMEYCIKLASIRDIPITAEAVRDYQSLKYLLKASINQFQTFLFSKKLEIDEYTHLWEKSLRIDYNCVEKILTDSELNEERNQYTNIFSFAEKLKMLS